VTCYIPRWFTRPQTVTHPSTNRAQCRLTTLIEANVLTSTLGRLPVYTAIWDLLSRVIVQMARPKSRAETVTFSHKAVVCRDGDGTLCLSFRVGDFRSSQLIGVRINALLVRKTAEPVDCGGHVRLHQEYLRVATETDDDFFFLAWPVKVVHYIDETSPLWELSPEQLLMSGFEIIVVLEACCEATGSTTQVRLLELTLVNSTIFLGVGGAVEF